MKVIYAYTNYINDELIHFSFIEYEIDERVLMKSLKFLKIFELCLKKYIAVLWCFLFCQVQKINSCARHILSIVQCGFVSLDK